MGKSFIFWRSVSKISKSFRQLNLTANWTVIISEHALRTPNFFSSILDHFFGVLMICSYSLRFRLTKIYFSFSLVKPVIFLFIIILLGSCGVSNGFHRETRTYLTIHIQTNQAAPHHVSSCVLVTSWSSDETNKHKKMFFCFSLKSRVVDYCEANKYFHWFKKKKWFESKTHLTKQLVTWDVVE